MMVEVSNHAVPTEHCRIGLTTPDHANRLGEHLLQASIVMEQANVH